MLEERSQSFIPFRVVVRLPKERRVDGPGDEERAERQRNEVRLRPAFIIIRHRVALTENALREIRVLEPVPAARVAARVDYARVLGKFPVPVDAGREDLAADAHGFFVGGYMLWCRVDGVGRQLHAVEQKLLLERPLSLIHI